MADMLYSGAGLFLGFRLGIVSGAYQIQTPSGSGAATDYNDAIIRVDGYIEQSQLIPDSNGGIKATLDNYDISQEIIDALNKVAKKAGVSAGTTPAAVVMETGVSRGGSGGSSGLIDIFWQSYGPLNAAATKHLMHWGVGNFDLNSGPIIYKNGQWIKPVITLNGKNAEYALSIDPLFWDPTVLKTSGTGNVGTLSVPQFSPYERDYLVKA
jgi:hypothetical protein